MKFVLSPNVKYDLLNAINSHYMYLKSFKQKSVSYRIHEIKLNLKKI